VKALEALGHTVRDLGDVAVGTERSAQTDDVTTRHLEAVRETQVSLADAVERSLRAGAYGLIIGGDHSLAIGALAGVARSKGPGGIIWLDAHADMNTPATSPTGNIHGMSMGAALGEMRAQFGPPQFPVPLVDPARCVFIGLRDVDPGERNALRERGMTCYTMSDIDRSGMPSVIERAIAIAGNGPASTHVSLDIDIVDPATAPGTGTPVVGGITYREAHLAMEIVAESGIAHSLELVEVNPTLDDGLATARLAVELICSALGKAIL
ncbi:MAG TPA: arginase, partial [Caldimonas sp.]|nr:arginase [Caldimonas sp.]